MRPLHSRYCSPFPRTPTRAGLPPDIVISNPQVYEVTITTKFVVPARARI